MFFVTKFKTKRKIIKVKHLIVQFIQIVVGTALVAGSTSLFLLPNQLSSGGFSGIATIVYYLLNIPLGTTVLVLNIPLFIMSLIKNGKHFFLNAIVGTAGLSIFLNVFEKLKPITTDRFLACIYGGIIAGIGTAIILKANASTGGTDLLTQIIKAYKPKTTSISNSQVLFEDYSFEKARVVFIEMVELGSLRLVENNFVTDTVQLYIGYSKDSINATGGTKKLINSTNIYSELLKAFLAIYDRTTSRNFAVRRIGISFTNVVETENVQLSLFTNQEELD